MPSDILIWTICQIHSCLIVQNELMFMNYVWLNVLLYWKVFISALFLFTDFKLHSNTSQSGCLLKSENIWIYHFSSSIITVLPCESLMLSLCWDLFEKKRWMDLQNILLSITLSRGFQSTLFLNCKRFSPKFPFRLYATLFSKDRFFG